MKESLHHIRKNGMAIRTKSPYLYHSGKRVLASAPGFSRDSSERECGKMQIMDISIYLLKTQSRKLNCHINYFTMFNLISMEDKSHEKLSNSSNKSQSDCITTDDLLNLIYENLSPNQEQEIKEKLKQDPEMESLYQDLKAAITQTDISEEALRASLTKGKKDLLDRLDQKKSDD